MGDRGASPGGKRSLSQESRNQERLFRPPLPWPTLTLDPENSKQTSLREGVAKSACLWICKTKSCLAGKQGWYREAPEEAGYKHSRLCSMKDEPAFRKECK